MPKKKSSSTARTTGAAKASGKGKAASSWQDRAIARMADTPGMRAITTALAHAEREMTVLAPDIVPPAQAFTLATVVNQCRQSASVIWLVCNDLRHQERIQSELETWGLTAHFLPELENVQLEDAILDPEIGAERLNVLHAILKHRDKPAAKRYPLVVNLLASSLDDEVALPNQLVRKTLTVRAGDELPPDELSDQLKAAGYEEHPQLFARGQFAVRGGIIDIFSFHADVPVRLEYFDTELESLREFDLNSQTSISKVKEAIIVLSDGEQESAAPLRSWIESKDDLVIGCDIAEPPVDLCICDDPPESATDQPMLEIDDLTTLGSPVGSFDVGEMLLSEAKHAAFVKQVREWNQTGWAVDMVFSNEGEIERFYELLSDAPDVPALIGCHIGKLSFGFTVRSARLAVLSADEVFGRFQVTRARKRFNREVRQRRVGHAVDIKELQPGDHVVHIDYGIARFRGLVPKPDATEDDAASEVLVLEYANDARLYVPLDQVHLVSRYVGTSAKPPALHTLGDQRWQRQRKKAEKSIFDYAAKMLAIQAEREQTKGLSHSADNKWQWDFEHSFPFRETTDQLAAIRDTKADMESSRPMDRLICGDVGFGKTEVAIRAMFKCVMGGHQAVLLCPTTVLAQQHYENFRRRMSDYPVTIALLSRLQKPAEQRKILKGLADGSIDMVIGTHRVASADIEYKKLGLAVVDEEQRFGVRHKDAFKERFRLIDVLTLSATPIPRTLYFSLMGAREMSTIETPPPNRLPVQTTVCPYDERIIRTALQRELKRGGQVYFLHNRVKTIEKMKEKLQALAPDARIVIGHGQMDSRELEDVMHTFVRGDADVLIATTIIESGIDIPNANTIFIDRADRFGLADLYQLRGRVGRSGHKAYAYLLLPRDMLTVGDARKRMNAIREYSTLGAGFKIAMRDLEIRGAGNLLGTQQSGHIAAIGFDMYCQLLKQSIAQLSGKPSGGRADVPLHIDFLAFSEADYVRSRKPVKREKNDQPKAKKLPAFLPSDYITDPKLRIAAYRMLAECVSQSEVDDLEKNWVDRFGKLPPAASHLLLANQLRVAAAQANVSAVEIKNDRLMLTKNRDYILINGKFPRLEAKGAPAKLRQAIKMVKTL
ncbi:transcription-repair coupling factor [Sulfuriroseicoccus oceanibius]|uniref:Transcription-repair-coupling factor n=1 Tax=Sulfuriroseicoccus oceanibius TaxID=2707525 RepID=A0A6B3KZX5_9BACT|nr:transcription-repair coupling factor [Sulfuriroseicoccus oceanibius]QQL46280.1 transcription-repair coupling factor [Sulfuriroseicoccus oceanibius]